LLGSLGPQAQQVLEQVAGSADRVRKAENADELAKEIALFPVATIDETTAHATLTAEPYPRAELGFVYFGKDPNHDNVWMYETQPFVLPGRPDGETLNQVDVSARGQDGTTYSSVTKIRYKP